MVYFLLGFVLVGLVVSSPTEYDENVKIIGGYDIDIKDVPYQIALIDNDNFRCGGSIISNDIIVTAAHCVSSKKAEDLKIRAGSSIRLEGGELVQVEDLIYHPSFSDMDYDIAVLRLARPLVFSEAIQPVTMIEEDEEIPDGDLTLVTGWGATEEHSNGSSILKGATVAKINAKVCAEAYDKMVPEIITPRMLCAASPGKSPCYGDSGGPLVHNGKLVGVVSWGAGCAHPEYPEVFAKVSALRRWIDETISDLTTKPLKRGI